MYQLSKLETYLNREVAKSCNSSSDSQSLLLGSTPFQRLLIVIGKRHLPPVSARSSTSVFITLYRCRLKTRLFDGSGISTRLIFGDPTHSIKNVSFHSRLPTTPQLPTHSERFNLPRKPFPSSVHKVSHSLFTCVFATKAKICT